MKMKDCIKIGIGIALGDFIVRSSILWVGKLLQKVQEKFRSDIKEVKEVFPDLNKDEDHVEMGFH